MGKASSSKKVARAARAAGRPGAGRSFGWPLTIGAVVVLGIALIVISRGGNEDAKPPVLGDHWHAAYGIYICDEFTSPLSDTIVDETGIHTHDDGLMHIHPFSTRYTGDGATINAFGITTDLELTDDSIQAGSTVRENGDLCAQEPGEVRVKVWSGPDDAEGRELEGDFGDYAPQEFDIITIAFVPEDAEIPKPPQEYIDEMQAPSDVTGTQPSVTTPAVSILPEGSTSTPDDPSATTASTAPTETTATTSPPDTTATSAP